MQNRRMLRLLSILLLLNASSAFILPKSQVTLTPTHFSSSSTTLPSSPLDQLTNFFKAPEPAKPLYEDVIVPPNPTLGAAFLAFSILLSQVALIPSIPVILFSVFLLIQTSRVRFVFDETSFSLQTAKPFSNDLQSSGENIVVGGENRWPYPSFVNYDFFPSAFPILVYFKETNTPEDKWEEGPGQLDKVGGGQVHFFPAIADVKVLKEEFEKRGCTKL